MRPCVENILQSFEWLPNCIVQRSLPEKVVLGVAFSMHNNFDCNKCAFDVFGLEYLKVMTHNISTILLLCVLAKCIT